MSFERKGILVISLHYTPEPNFIAPDVARALSADADVTVITAFPNYPFGRFYDGRRHFLPRKTIEDGVTIWRVPMIPDRSKSKLRRLLVYGSFTIAATVVAPFVVDSASAVWVYNTPPTAGLAALWFKAINGARVVFTYADLWPESFIATGVSKPGPIVTFFFVFRKWLNTLADEIIGSTRGTVQRFLEDGVPSPRLHYLPVWVQGIKETSPESRDDPPRIVYAGNMGPAQNLDVVIAAAAELQRRGSAVRFDLYGSGTEDERLKKLAQESGALNVVFHGRVDPDVAFHASSRALAQLVTLRPDPMFDMTLPSKLAFSFAAGAPVLYSLRGEAAAVAEQSGAGFYFGENDSDTLVAHIKYLLALGSEEKAALGQRLREYYRVEFSSAMLLERYRAIILGPESRHTRP